MRFPSQFFQYNNNEQQGTTGKEAILICPRTLRVFFSFKISLEMAICHFLNIVLKGISKNIHNRILRKGKILSDFPQYSRKTLKLPLMLFLLMLIQTIIVVHVVWILQTSGENQIEKKP